MNKIRKMRSDLDNLLHQATSEIEGGRLTKIDKKLTVKQLKDALKVSKSAFNRPIRLTGMKKAELQKLYNELKNRDRRYVRKNDFDGDDEERDGMDW